MRVVWISDNYYHKILRKLSLTFSNNWTINDWLSAAGLIREWRSFESSTMHDLVWYEICSLPTVIWTSFQAFPYIKTLELTSWLKSYFSSDIKRCNRGGALICKYTQISAAVVLIHVCWIICGKGAVLSGLFMVGHLRSYIKNSTQYFIRYPDTCTLKSVFKNSATPRFSTHFSVSGYRIKPCLSFLIYYFSNSFIIHDHAVKSQ